MKSAFSLNRMKKKNSSKQQLVAINGVVLVFSMSSLLLKCKRVFFTCVFYVEFAVCM